jgi:hypothetical protein
VWGGSTCWKYNYCRQITKPRARGSTIPYISVNVGDSESQWTRIFLNSTSQFISIYLWTFRDWQCGQVASSKVTCFDVRESTHQLHTGTDQILNQRNWGISQNSEERGRREVYFRTGPLSPKYVTIYRLTTQVCCVPIAVGSQCLKWLTAEVWKQRWRMGTKAAQTCTYHTSICCSVKCAYSHRRSQTDACVHRSDF